MKKKSDENQMKSDEKKKDREENGRETEKREWEKRREIEEASQIIFKERNKIR